MRAQPRAITEQGARRCGRKQSIELHDIEAAATPQQPPHPPQYGRIDAGAHDCIAIIGEIPRDPFEHPKTAPALLDQRQHRIEFFAAPSQDNLERSVLRRRSLPPPYDPSVVLKDQRLRILPDIGPRTGNFFGALDRCDDLQPIFAISRHGGVLAMRATTKLPVWYGGLGVEIACDQAAHLLQWQYVETEQRLIIANIRFCQAVFEM